MYARFGLKRPCYQSIHFNKNYPMALWAFDIVGMLFTCESLLCVDIQKP